MTAPRPIAERFWEKVHKTSTCWEWTASLNALGYGKFGKSSGRGHEGAHRVSWWLTNGPIPSGLYVLHRCDNPKCVRPDHLFLGTNADNLRDAAQKGRMSPQAHPERYLSVLARGRATSSAKAAARPCPTCVNCERVISSKVRRQGRCGACSEYLRKHGIERSKELQARLQGRA